MTKNKKAKLIIKLLILLLVLLLLTRLISFTLSKYESFSKSNGDVEIAFYILNKDFQTMNLNLDSILPRDEPYVYSFSVGNTNGKENAQIDLEYNLSIRTTTNLPLTYELYKNQEYTDSDAINIIKTNEVAQDADGTYFRTITTDKVQLNYTDITTDIYQLVVRFPSIYNTTDYQDIIEAIEIDIDSNQVMDE